MKRTIVGVVGVVLLFSCISCDKSPSGPKDNPEQSAAYVDSANAALGEYISGMMNHPPQNISDVDFTAINSLYRQAVEYDPQNPQANFGAGVTELLMITQNQAFQEEITRWQNFIATSTMFGVPIGNLGGMAKSSPSPQLLLNNPLQLQPESSMMTPKMFLKAATSLPEFVLDDPPNFSDFQDLIETDILDRINYSLDRLAVVEEHPAFTFYITPQMQGNTGIGTADSLELDLTEVYLFDAQLQAAKLLSYLAISYSVDMDPYDSSAIENRLAQDGDFLTLRKEGTMESSYAGLTGIVEKLSSAIVFLGNEKDDQTNDIIVISADPEAPNPVVITPQDLATLQNAAILGSSVLSEPYMILDDFNHDGQIEQLNVDFSALFSPEIQDFKDFLPPYSVSTGTDTAEQNVYESDQYVISTTVTPDSAGDYYYGYSISWYPESEEYEDEYGSILLPEIKSLVRAKYDSIKTALGENLDNIYFQVNWDGHLDEGENQVMVPVYYGYGGKVQSFAFVYPIITWNADSFEEWANSIPEPTINGIFPDFTSGMDMVTFFGYTGETWQKTFDPTNPPTAPADQ